MPWSVEYDPQLQAVVILNFGAVTAEDVRRQTGDALALAKEHGARRYLMDASRLTNSISPLDTYNLPKLYQDLGADRRGKLAVLAPERADLQDGMRFYETVCRNQGFDVRIFATRADAVAWLEA